MFICNHLTIQSNNWNKLIGFHIHGNGINGCEVYRESESEIASVHFIWRVTVVWHYPSSWRAKCWLMSLLNIILVFGVALDQRFLGTWDFFLQSPITHPPLLRGWKNHVHPAVHKGKNGCKNVFQVNLYNVTAEILLFFSTNQICQSMAESEHFTHQCSDYDSICVTTNKQQWQKKNKKWLIQTPANAKINWWIHREITDPNISAISYKLKEPNTTPPEN